MQIIAKELDTEKPNSASAVIPTLIAVTGPVPSFLVRRSDMRLEKIVPPAIIMETIPANDRGTLNAVLITGQAEPNNESGKPRLIKAI
jgi:hypothetical protein